MVLYERFADVYDILNQNAEYERRAGYVLGIFEKFDKIPSLMLDLACGTGSFTEQFLRRGIDVIGVDQSEDMLMRAREKCSALFICQKASELELFGTVDGAVCMLDSVNHITDYDELLASFKRVHLFLEPGRLFVFDVNTAYKHQNILGDNAFNFDCPDFFAAWQNERTEYGTHIYIDIFRKKGGLYERFSEDFYERAYSGAEIEDLLKKSGFELLAVYDDLSLRPPAEKSERLYYVARRMP